jgi:hypothetical protein
METKLPDAAIPAVRIPKILIRNKYGDAIEALQVNEFIEVSHDDQRAVLNYLARKYGTSRLHRTSTSGDITRLFRLK